MFFELWKWLISFPHNPRFIHVKMRASLVSACIGVSRQTAYNIWFIHIESGEYIWRILSGQKYQL
jgi:hypothetical protein